jgi:peptide deformylase
MALMRTSLPILTFPDPVLDTPCDEAEFDLETAELAADLAEYVSDRGHGAAGLAAPQVGVSKRIAAMRFGQGGTVVMFNPTIKWKSPVTSKQVEGCLSLPGQRFSVERSHKITVEYFTVQGVKRMALLEGWDARVAQHEIDHLDGRLICHIGVLVDG